MADGTFTIEAEDIIASGFVTEDNTAASGGQSVSLAGSGGTTGTLSYTFTATSGSYSLSIAAFDENDGAASFDVLVNGELVASFVMDNSTPSGVANARTLRDFVVDDLDLSTGDVIEISGAQEGGEWVRIDNLTFSPLEGGGTSDPTPTTGDVIEVEAEDIIDVGYVVETSSAASGGEYASLFNGSVDGSPTSGALSYTFTGDAGEYTLDLSVFDENDGASELDVYVNGALVTTVVMNSTSGTGGVSAASLTVYSIEGLQLSTGDNIEIVGARDNAEWARIDKLTFTATSSTGGGNTAPTGSLSDVSVEVGASTTIDLDAAFSDVDGDALTYSISGPAAAGASISGSTLTLNPSAAGDYTVTVTANDGTEDSSPVAFTLSATDVQDNVAPTGSISDMSVEIGSPETIYLDSYFSDLNGDSLSYSISGAGSSIASLSGSTLTLNPTQAGFFTIVVTANDGELDSAPVTFTVTASEEPTNSAPTGAISDAAVEIGTPETLDLDTLFTDADGDALTYSLSGSGASIASLSGSTLTLDPSAEGVYELIVTANDGALDSTPVVFTVTASDPATTGTPGDPFTVEAEDMTMDGYVVASSRFASGGEYASLFTGSVDTSSTTGSLSYTFAAGTGSYDVTLSVFDENDGAADLKVYVNGVLIDTIVMDGASSSAGVGNGSKADYTLSNVSIATGDVVEIVGTVEGGEWARVDAVTFTPLGEVVEPENTAPTGAISDVELELGQQEVIYLDSLFSDVDGDVLSYTVSGAGASIASLSGSTLTIDPTEAGDFEITITANDGLADSDPVTFTVSATEPPVDDGVYTIEAEDIIATGFVVENSTPASEGEVASLLNSGGSTGTLSYTFDGVEGVYTLDLKVFDESDGVSQIDVLVNGEIVSTITLDNATGHGGMGVQNLLTFSTEDLELTAGDVITVEANQDSNEWTRIDQLVLTKTGDILPPENYAPTGDMDDIVNKIGESQTIDLNTVFTDVDGDVLSFVLAGPGTTFSFLSGSNLVISPTDPEVFGDFELTVVAYDGELYSQPVTFTVTVPEPNETPEGAPSAVLAAGTEDTPYLISEADLLQGITDADGDALSVTEITTSEGTVVAAGEGVWVLTTGADFNGDVTLTYTVADARGEALEGLTQTVSFTPVNDAPVVGDPTGFFPDIVEDGFASLTVEQLNTKLAALVSDVDGDDLTVTLTISYPAESGIDDDVIVIDPTQPLTWAPPADFNGDVTLSVSVDDGAGESNSVTVGATTATITVAPANDAPIVVDETVFDIDNVEIGTPVSIDVSAAFTDIDGDALTFSLSGAGAALASLDGSTLTIDPSEEGDIELTVTAADPSGESVSYDFTVPAVTPNAAPVGYMPDFTIYVGSAIVLDLSSAFSDLNGDEISYTITGEDTSFVSLNGDLLSIAPTERAVWGDFDITITAYDGIEFGEPVTFTVSVPDPNQGPTGVPTAVLADGTEDVAYVISEADLLQGISDPDGDTLSVTAISASAGTIVDNLDGTFTLTPPEDFNGEVTLTYTVNDGLSGYIYDLTQSVDILAANDAPTINDPTGLIPDVDEDGAVVLSAQEVSAKLAALVSDIDGETPTVTLTLVYPAESGISDKTIVMDPAQPLIWSPPADFNGEIAVTVTADDGTGESNTTATSQFTLTVNPTNDAPVIADLSSLVAEIDEDETATATVEEVNAYLSAYIADIDGDDLTVSFVVDYPAESGIAQETIVIDPTQAFSWTPYENFNGVVQVTVVVDDGQGESNSVATDSFTLTVNPTNDAPAAQDDLFDVLNDGTAFTGNVLADNGSGADSDIDGDSISVVEVTSGATTQGGVVSIDSAGNLSYTAAEDFYGSDTFTYTITDGELTSEATITFDVTPDDAAPVANDDTFYLGAGETVSGNVLADNGAGADWDPDGGSVSFQYPSSWVTSGFLTLSGDGSFSFTAPNSDFSGSPISFTYVIVDDEGDTAEGTVTFIFEEAASSSANFSVGARVDVAEFEDTSSDFLMSAEGTDASSIAPLMISPTGVVFDDFLDAGLFEPIDGSPFEVLDIAPVQTPIIDELHSL